METVRYRPGEALRWLKVEGDARKRGASERGRGVSGGGDFKEKIGAAAGAAVEYGRGAYARMLHEKAQGSEYVLTDDRFEIVHGNQIKAVPYANVRAVKLKGDRALVVLDQGSVLIRPLAHLSAGRARVPIGWSRNGAEVPFEMLADEIAARSGLKLIEE
jgi:hypothetical protein